MMRSLGEIIVISVWLVTLLFLVPYRGVSFFFALLYVRLPLSIANRSEVIDMLKYSYLFGLMLCFITSVIVVALADNRRRTLAVVIRVDLIAIAIALVLTFVFRW